MLPVSMKAAQKARSSALDTSFLPIIVQALSRSIPGACDILPQNHLGTHDLDSNLPRVARMRVPRETKLCGYSCDLAFPSHDEGYQDGSIPMSRHKLPKVDAVEAQKPRAKGLLRVCPGTRVPSHCLQEHY